MLKKFNYHPHYKKSNEDQYSRTNINCTMRVRILLTCKTFDNVHDLKKMLTSCQKIFLGFSMAQLSKRKPKPHKLLGCGLNVLAFYESLAH